MYGLQNRMKAKGQRICEIEDRAIESTPSELQRENGLEKKLKIALETFGSITHI